MPGNVKKQMVVVVRKHFFLDGLTAPRTAVMDTFPLRYVGGGGGGGGERRYDESEHYANILLFVF